MIYKRAKVEVPIISAKAGEMICICLSELVPLRLEAPEKLDKINQQVLLTRMAIKLQLSEKNLLTLIRD